MRDRFYEIISLGSADTEAALDAYWRGYQCAFPDDDERMTREELEGAAVEDDYEIMAIVDPHGQVVAGLQLGLLRTPFGAVGMIEYRWVAQSQRRTGLGRALYDLALNRFEDAEPDHLGVVGEVNDPRLMSHDALTLDRGSMEPNDRLAHHRALGYRVIDAVYAQPPHHLDRRAVWHLMLMFRPRIMTERAISAPLYHAILDAHFGRFVCLDTDVTCLTLRQTVPSEGEIELIDVAAPRSCLDLQAALGREGSKSIAISSSAPYARAR